MSLISEVSNDKMYNKPVLINARSFFIAHPTEEFIAERLVRVTDDDKILNKRTAKGLDSFCLTEELQSALKKDTEQRVASDISVTGRKQEDSVKLNGRERKSCDKNDELLAKFETLKSFVEIEKNICIMFTYLMFVGITILVNTFFSFPCN